MVECSTTCRLSYHLIACFQYICFYALIHLTAQTYLSWSCNQTMTASSSLRYEDDEAVDESSEGELFIS